MLPYIIRRLLNMIPLIFGITFIAFMVFQLAPGDYFTKLSLDPNMSPELLQKMRSEFALDKPALVQYLIWLKQIFSGNLGLSFHYQIPVWDLIKSFLLNTFILSLSALIFTWFLALPLGVLSAVKQYKWPDKVTSFFAFLGMSLPNFFLAFLLLFLVSQTRILPSGGMKSPLYDLMGPGERILDVLMHLILPTVVLGLGSLAGLLRIMRGNMLEVLGAKYILTARAKGLPERVVVFKHAFRNAINPMITIFGYELSSLFSGAALVEMILRWPGLGQLMLDATLNQDIYLIMGNLLMGSLLLLLGNLIADILLALSDPRVRDEFKS